MKHILNASGAIALSLAAMTQAHALTIETFADTYLSNDSQTASTGADDAHGTETSLQLRYGPASRLRMPVVQFDISDLQDFTGAAFNFELTQAQNNTRTLSLYGVSESLAASIDESTFSYDDAAFIQQPSEGGPAYNSGNWQFDGGTLNTFTAATTLTFLGSFSNAPGSIGLKSFSGTALENFLSANTSGFVTFIIGGPTAGEIYTIAAKEHATALAPTLDLPNAIAVPEPSAFALLAGIAGMGCVGLRRRRRA